MRIPHTKYHLGSAQLRELATLAVVERLAEFEECHDDEEVRVKVSTDFRRADFSCQWKRNVGKMAAYIASLSTVRGGSYAIHTTARVRPSRLHDE